MNMKKTRNKKKKTENLKMKKFFEVIFGLCGSPSPSRGSKPQIQQKPPEQGKNPTPVDTATPYPTPVDTATPLTPEQSEFPVDPPTFADWLQVGGGL